VGEHGQAYESGASATSADDGGDWMAERIEPAKSSR